HRLKPTVWVLTDTTSPLRRGEGVRAGIVEEQERADPRAKAFVGKQRSDRKAVSDPVAALTAIVPKDIFQSRSPVNRPGADGTPMAYSESGFAQFAMWRAPACALPPWEPR
ncbi:MAG: hypothetical protein QOF90_3142, partial [Acetobacteraceae bacterium]|nr:hypothetical protein [Acetobacteraceae bacterium]